MKCDESSARRRFARILDRNLLLPVLFSVFPILFLLANNLGEIPEESALRSLALSIAFASVLYFLASSVLQSTAKAALVTTAALAVFFSYGHIYDVLRSFTLAGVIIGRHRILLPALCTLLLLIVVFVRRARTISPTVLTFMGATFLLLNLIPAAQIVRHLAAQRMSRSNPVPQTGAAPTLDLVKPEEPRDVYYIILDAYTRQDVLLDEYDYDNSDFINSLEQLGFFVAQDSRSNYAVTRLSIPSSLNMAYIDDLGFAVDTQAKDAQWLDQAGRYSAVRELFESMGYTIVAFESAYGLTNWTDSDLFLSPRPISMSDAVAFGTINPFEQLLIETTMARVAVDMRVVLNRLFGVQIQDPNQQHRERILFALDRLGQLSDITSPKFVFLHLMSPHPPYIFNADGSLADEDGIFTLNPVEGSSSIKAREHERYRNQLQYLNTRILDAVRVLIQTSRPEPIIVIQGDHGAFKVSHDDRMKILNAYFLPDAEGGLLSDSISPVNSFRLIFDLYFGAQLPLLEDRGYYSENSLPFDLERIY